MKKGVFDGNFNVGPNVIQVDQCSEKNEMEFYMKLSCDFFVKDAVLSSMII